ncbi:hypothetical protein SAMN06295905_1754 [Devosia lucknowensis]|uniref:Uncharacterized protein n=2 Tax=Devosia lucknowensis TaxID=1096929 RepID=A0A1Y6F8Y6_9HYPH|nr:hypothetical protein SAMN06295905_1754 [Devosia lucknowensis]
MTGHGEFGCDVNVDGGGITFVLPEGDVFVFAHEADGEGLGYLIAADQQPGRSPDELGRFVPIEGEQSCWFGAKDDITFCVAVEQ